jgi:TRAP transporter 4TM/12TM fusion protein
MDKANSGEIKKSTRELTGLPKMIVNVIAIGLSVWLLYSMFILPADTLKLRAVFTGLVMAIGFLIRPASAKKFKERIQAFDLLLAGLSISVIVYLLIEYRDLIFRMGVSPTTLDIVFGSIVILLIIEISRRTTGPTLPILAIVFLLYTFFGDGLPGVLAHPKYSIARTVSFLFGVQGIYSEPLGVAATFVFMFVFFGTLLHISGAGEAIIDFAKALTGSKRGGPAKVAIVSSALFGSISGSAVSNVVVTGTFTIPMMKKTGYPGYYAAAVEAVASTGGQITPPVLGAAAFLIAETLGISYSSLVIATIIPALLFYVGLFFMVDFEAAKRGLKPLPKSQLPKLGDVIKNNGYLLLPIVILLFFLVVVKISPLRSALWSCVSVIALSYIRPKNAISFKKLIDALINTPKDIVTITSTCAAAGIVIGTMSLTGLGHRFALMVVSYSNGNILIALVLTMIIAIILGMGLPPVAAYAIAGSAIGPALVELGVAPLSAHLFIFYFCAISVITPPVALAAYAAAALAGENMWKVGITAFKIGIAAYLVPYLFVQEPALLMEGFGLVTIYRVLLSIIGVIILAGGVEGWMGKKIKPLFRIILIAGALLMIYPNIYTDLIALGITIFVTISIKAGFGACPEDEHVDTDKSMK